MPPSHKILTPRICLQCGKSFEATPCQIRHGRGKHCSRACQYMTVAKLNSQRTKGTIREGSWEDRTCPVCGKVFRKKKGYKTIHCSRLCAHQNPQSRRHISESLKSSERAKSARVGGIQRMNAAMPTDRRSALVKTAWQRPEIRQRIMEGIQRRSASAEWRSAPQFQKGNQHPRWFIPV
jgi:hypothetical protein